MLISFLFASLHQMASCLAKRQARGQAYGPKTHRRFATDGRSSEKTLSSAFRGCGPATERQEHSVLPRLTPRKSPIMSFQLESVLSFWMALFTVGDAGG